jgi:integrase
VPDPVQAVRPSTITKIYRDLLTSGGRDGQPLAVATVAYLHAVLRKAFHDAVIVDELIGSNPVERTKRPRARHRVASLLSGVPVHVVAARLGHADPAITLRVYVHVIRSAEAAAADIFADVVNAAC